MSAAAVEQDLRDAEDHYFASLRAHADAAIAHHMALRRDREALARGESSSPASSIAVAAVVVAVVDADDECRRADKRLRECQIAYLRSLGGAT